MGDYVVTTLDDELDYSGSDATIELMGGLSDLSLREAIFLSNLNAIDADTISFAIGGAVVLTQGQLTLAGNVTIDGDIDGDDKADITIDASGQSRVIAVEAGADATLESLTITGGAGSDFGGGIYNLGNLTIEATTVSGNSATVGGGGIYNNGTLSVRNSTISGNQVTQGSGGGLFADTSATTDLTNVTIFGNTAAGAGGG